MSLATYDESEYRLVRKRETTRYVLEGEWSGYRSGQRRIVHREVISKKRAGRLKNLRCIVYSDGTSLEITVRPGGLPREGRDQEELFLADLRRRAKWRGMLQNEGIMSIDAATPRPWFVVNTGGTDTPMMSIMAERIAGKGPTHEVALCGTGDNSQEMEDANAALIVKAVNCHDDLLAALKAVLNCFHSSPPALTLSALELADAAINKAEAA